MIRKNTFSFVILNYNTYIETCNFIESVERIKTKDINVNYVIVDNDSTDDSVKLLKNKYRKVNYIEFILEAENIGFSKANNAGYIYVEKKYKPDYIIVTNSDIVIVSKDFFNKVIEEYNRFKWGVLGPDIYALNYKEHQNPVYGHDYSISDIEEIIEELKIKMDKMLLMKSKGVNRIQKKFLSNFYRKLRINIKNFICCFFRIRYKKMQFNICLHGSFYIFSREFINCFNEKCFFPEPFFYGEEDILFYNCKKNNIKTCYMPNIKVNHLKGGSVNKSIGNKEQINRIIFKTKNELESKKILRDYMKNCGRVNM